MVNGCVRAVPVVVLLVSLGRFHENVVDVVAVNTDFSLLLGTN